MALPVPTRSGGYPLEEADWDDYIKDLQNQLPWRLLVAHVMPGGTSSVTFSSIPQTYDSLMVVCFARSEVSALSDTLAMRFNGDSGGNYDYEELVATGASRSAIEQFGQVRAKLATIPGASAPVGAYGVAVATVPHYSNATRNKMATTMLASKLGTAASTLSSNKLGQFWRSNAAITSLTVLLVLSNFASGSLVSLYAKG